MARLPLLIALAGIVTVMAGLLLLSSGGPAPMPTAAPSVSSAPTSSSNPSAIPEALAGGWLAASRGTAIEDPSVTIISFERLGDRPPSTVSIDRQGFSPILLSTAMEVSPGVLELRSENINGGCQSGHVGTYRSSASTDGQWLTLSIIDDECPARGDVLPGTWQRSLAHDSRGGPGVSTALTPFVQFTLPPGTYSGRGTGERDTMVIDSATATYKVWKNLEGFADPCDIVAGRLAVEPGLDGLLAYFEDDPRFEITRREEYELDGHRAVEIEITVGANLTPPCWTLDGDAANLNGVLTWAVAATPVGSWNDKIGGNDALVITEVDGATLTFEFLTFEGSDFSVDRATLDTIRFFDALPVPPPG